MKPFLSEDFLLRSDTARVLYHEFAEGMSILDFHSHLPVQEIASDRRFENLTQIWLQGDHYKWRAMRAAGVEERLITGDASDEEKFLAWAQTVPKTLGNPLYHWTHLELKRYFGISGKVLCPETAQEIYRTCSEMLGTEGFKVRDLLKRMNVTVLCTTDDSADDLSRHFLLQRDSSFPVRVVPAFRPDRALAIDVPEAFNPWLDRLGEAADVDIADYGALLHALRRRHDAFHEAGCRVSDHGLDRPYAEPFREGEIERIFQKARGGVAPSQGEVSRYRTAILLELARMSCEKGWAQQFHLGALRNVNSRAWKILGPDSGYDTMGDAPIAGDLARFLDLLDQEERLGRTILYAMNPRDHEAMAALIGCFQDGKIPGKIQLGPAWWFNDQKHGIEGQLKALSSMGFLSLFVGMVTDSRSFLSFPRHEYFRRILCNTLGEQVEQGELPSDLDLLGGLVRDICYWNAVRYFGIGVE